MQESSIIAENTLDLIPEPGMDKFFHGGHWGQCLELLTHLCQYSDSILLVTGPAGIGKTALKQALLTNSADKFIFCEIDSSPDLDSAAILQKIESGFEMALIDNVDYDAQHVELVLLIEDAHKLQLDVIGTLLQLKQTMRKEKQIHLVLFARPEFEARVQHSALKDVFNEQVHTIELETLTPNEVEAFLKHQWQLEGHQTDFPIEKAGCKKIYSMTGGIPGEVKKLAQTYFSKQPVEKVMNNRGRLSPFTVGLTVSFGLLFCLLAFLWPAADDSTVAQTAPLNSEFKNSHAETVVLSTLPAEAPKQPELVAQTNYDADFTEQLPPPEPNAVISEAPLTPLPATDQANVTTEIAGLPGGDIAADKISRMETKILSLQQQLEKEQEARKIAELKIEELQRSVASKKAAQKSTPKSASKSALSSASSSENLAALNKQEKQILSKAGKHYALQILGSSNEQRIKEFIRDHHLSTKAHYFRTTHNGKPWFILLYGDYPTREAATKAITLLPGNLKKLQPWPREYAQVQQTIKKID